MNTSRIFLLIATFLFFWIPAWGGNTATPISTSARVSSNFVNVSMAPKIDHSSDALRKAMKALRDRIVRDGKSCEETANAMDASGYYEATIVKTLETKNLVVLEIGGSYQCDGMHPNGYRYGIALNIANGKRVDLSEIYAIGRREKTHLFLTDASADLVLKMYKSLSDYDPNCLEEAASKERLMGLPFTVSVKANGNVTIYFDRVAQVEAACFTPVELDGKDIKLFRNASQADEYGLP